MPFRTERKLCHHTPFVFAVVCIRIFSAVLYLTVFTHGALAQDTPSRPVRDLASCIYRGIRIAGTDTLTIRYETENPTIVRRLNRSQKKILKPNYTITVEGKDSLPVRVVSTHDFLSDEFLKLKDSGFFTVWTPSEQAGPQVGHSEIIAGDAFFDRNLDGKAESVRSVKLDQLLSLANFPRIAVMQFFELSPGSLRALNTFFHDRTWNFHAGVPEFITTYVDQPITKTPPGVRSENCTTFIFSFLDPYWIALRPELASVRRELGSLLVNQVPNRQFINNSKSPAYRGTFILSNDSQATEQGLVTDGLRNDPLGSQLLVVGVVVGAAKRDP